jgi:hypothetical protein
LKSIPAASDFHLGGKTESISELNHHSRYNKTCEKNSEYRAGYRMNYEKNYGPKEESGVERHGNMDSKQ